MYVSTDFLFMTLYHSQIKDFLQINQEGQGLVFISFSFDTLYQLPIPKGGSNHETLSFESSQISIF